MMPKRRGRPPKTVDPMSADSSLKGSAGGKSDLAKRPVGRPLKPGPETVRLFNPQPLRAAGVSILRHSQV
jgi:hypothetical protein